MGMTILTVPVTREYFGNDDIWFSCIRCCCILQRFQRTACFNKITFMVVARIGPYWAQSQPFTKQQTARCSPPLYTAESSLSSPSPYCPLTSQSRLLSSHHFVFLEPSVAKNCWQKTSANFPRCFQRYYLSYYHCFHSLHSLTEENIAGKSSSVWTPSSLYLIVFHMFFGSNLNLDIESVGTPQHLLLQYTGHIHGSSQELKRVLNIFDGPESFWPLLCISVPHPD